MPDMAPVRHRSAAITRGAVHSLRLLRLEHAIRHGATSDILVAVQGEGDHIEEMTTAPSEVTTLVTSPASAELVTALQGRAFPSFYLLEDGRAHPFILPSPVPAH